MIIFCIVLNAIFIAATKDYEIRNLHSPLPVEMVSIELGFMGVWIFELLLKLAVHRLYFFCNTEMGWNIADTFLVVFSMVDLAVMLLDRADDNTSSVNLSIMRLIRMFKFVKVLRSSVQSASFQS